jgi:hypothetical protein
MHHLANATFTGELVDYYGNGRLGMRVQGSTLVQPIAFAPGDRLWVKEAYRAQEEFDDLLPKEIMADFEAELGHPSFPTFYEADRQCDGFSIEMWQQSPPGRLRASMHMPRCASRLTLLVTEVRVERLQDISEDDAAAEGWPAPEDRAKTGLAEIRDAYPIGWFAWLWDSINGPGAWDVNPWVAAYSFTVLRQNIDECAQQGKTP